MASDAASRVIGNVDEKLVVDLALGLCRRPSPRGQEKPAAAKDTWK